MLPRLSISIVQSFRVVGDAETPGWPLCGAPPPKVSLGVRRCTSCLHGSFSPGGPGRTWMGSEALQCDWEPRCSDPPEITLGPLLGSMSRSSNSRGGQTQTSVSCLDPSKPFFPDVPYLPCPFQDFSHYLLFLRLHVLQEGRGLCLPAISAFCPILG